MKKFLLTLLAALITGMAPLLAGEKPTQLPDDTYPCKERSAVERILNEEWFEGRRGIGLTDGGKVLEFYTSRVNKTWTIVFTDVDGTSCLIASGQNWEYDSRSLEEVFEESKPLGPPL